MLSRYAIKEEQTMLATVIELLMPVESFMILYAGNSVEKYLIVLLVS